VTPPNLTHPKWNRRSITAGTKIAKVPDEWSAYDELWAHLVVHGVTGSPSACTVKPYWQIAHAQDSGGRHDQDPTWRTLDWRRESNLLVGGIDWPVAALRNATADADLSYVRGITLGAGRVRLAVDVALAGGTSPKAVLSLSLHARKGTSAPPAPLLNPEVLAVENQLYGYIRDVWGYSVSNAGESSVLVTLRSGASNGEVVAQERLAAGVQVTRHMPRPLRCASGLYFAVSETGVLSDAPVVYTSDNIDDTL